MGGMRTAGTKRKTPAHPDEFFIGKRLMVVTAHPDDEGIAAGTMYKNHRAGGTTFLVCATYGEKGKSHLDRPVSDAALKRIRKQELLRAAEILKIDRVLFLGMPDAGVRGRRADLYRKLLPIVRRIKPDYILSFGPDGMSGHWDHITVGGVSLRIARRENIPMLAFTISPEFRRALPPERFMARRKFGSYRPGAPQHRESDVKIAVNAAVKRRAWSSHRSQFSGRPPRFHFPYEHFVRE